MKLYTLINDTNVSEQDAAFFFRVEKEKCRQHIPPKHWYPSSILGGVTVQKTSTNTTIGSPSLI
jgi:hypothetical protein